MDYTERVDQVLAAYKDGLASTEDVISTIRYGAMLDLGYAQLDLDRKRRQGFSEVVYCAGKTIEQSLAIIAALSQEGANVLATRASSELYAKVVQVVPAAKYHELPRLITIEQSPLTIDPQRTIAVLCAGTSDLPVAEEAAVTAEIMGNKVERIYDVGVAGLHRLLAHLEEIRRANVLIVVAGMEGALASVVGGLVARPVIAVPTSVGYGANFQGLSALLSMLNSCAAGVAVVNIDNGFGAGRLASMINRGGQ